MSKLWLNDDRDIANVLRVYEMHPYVGAPDMANIEKTVAKARDFIVGGGKLDRDQWDHLFAVLSSMTLDLIGPGFRESDFIELLLSKHKLYGLKSLTAWREIGVLSRIDQKIARAVNMTASMGATNHSARQMGETLDDTLLDIVGYCVIGWHMIRNLPNKGDKP